MYENRIIGVGGGDGVDQVARNTADSNAGRLTTLGESLDTVRSSIYSYFPIWAEENANLNADSYEWAFGNGNDTPSGTGIVVPFDCELVGAGITHEGDATTRVGIIKNTSSSGKHVSTTSSRKGWESFEDSPVSYVAGDVVNFHTITGSDTSNGSVVVAWFRRRVEL